MKRKILVLLLAVVMLLSIGVFLYGMLGDCDTDPCNSILGRIGGVLCRHHGGCTGLIYDYGVCVHGICEFEVTAMCADGERFEATLWCAGKCPK